MFVLSVFCITVGIIHQQLQYCSAMSDETVAVQLAFLTEQKFEDLSRENLNLKTPIEAVEENRDIKDQPQSEGIKITSHYRDDYTDNETNTNTIENNHSYNVENGREKEEHYESHPDLETMADAVKSNSDLKETTTNKVNENPKHGISKEKRLLIDSVTTPPLDVAKIAFYAALTHDLSVGQHQIVEYDKVITNVGNAYDSRHGHFTAPVKGVYLISLTLMNVGGGTMDIEMVRNGVRVAYGFGGPTDYNMGTQVAIVVLEKGDMVWVRHAPSSTEALRGNEYNTFAGTLLFTV